MSAILQPELNVATRDGWSAVGTDAGPLTLETGWVVPATRCATTALLLTHAAPATTLRCFGSGRKKLVYMVTADCGSDRRGCHTPSFGRRSRGVGSGNRASSGSGVFGP